MREQALSPGAIDPLCDVHPNPWCGCLIYEQNKDRDQMLLGYLEAGLKGGQQVVFIVPGPLQKTLRTGLGKRGLDTVEAEDQGSLVCMTPESLGLLTAGSPSEALACLAAIGRKARSQGFSRARIYWEMSGALLEKDLDWLQECLLGCGSMTVSAGEVLLCGFDRRQVTNSLLVAVLPLYPQLIHQGKRCVNPYYVATDTKSSASGGKWFGDCSEDNGIRYEKLSRRPYRRGQVLDAIFAAAPIGLWMLNKEQRMVFTNHNFCLATGVSEEQFLRAPHYSQVMRAEDAIDCMLSDARAFNADGAMESEEQIRSPDGSPHVYRIVKTKLINQQQEVEGLLGLAIDITEQKEAEGRLRYSEARFRDIALSIADFIWEIDAAGRFSYCSDKVEEMLGFSADELLGQSCFDLFAKREARRLERWFCVSARNQQGFRDLQTWALNKGGQKRYLRIGGMPIFSHEGHYQGFRGVTEDVTECKEAEAGTRRALVEAEQARDQIDNIINSTADGLIVTAPGRHHILMLNESARQLIQSGEICPLGQALDTVLQDTLLLQQIRSIYASHAPPFLQTDFAQEKSAAGRRILQARTSLMRNKQGRVSGAITALRDVTREREQDRMKADFMSMAAHELRTPLTAILGYSELCMDPEEFGGFSAEQQKEFIGEINSKAEVLAKLVNDLLDISRLETGKPLPLSIGEVAVGKLCALLLDRYRMLAPKHVFEVNLAKDLPGTVPADRDKLEQVLENLLSNAVKYSPEGSLITIHAEKRDGYCQIVVADPGIGMTCEQSERVFDKFYRADFSNTSAKGIGLGMSIAKQIVEQHGGSIWLKSVPGVGTRVTFSLPLTAAG